MGDISACKEAEKRIADLERELKEKDVEIAEKAEENCKLLASIARLREEVEKEFQRAEGKDEMKKYFQIEITRLKGLLSRAEEVLSDGLVMWSKSVRKTAKSLLDEIRTHD